MTGNTSQPGPDREPPSRQKTSSEQLLVGGFLLVVMVLVFYWTSGWVSPHREDEMPPLPSFVVANENQTAPATQPSTASVEAQTSIADSSDPFVTRVAIDTLADTQAGWLTITRKSNLDPPSSATARYRDDNKFDIDTTNVEWFDLDLSALPVKEGQRLILHIDGQNMEVYPKQRGKITFSRSSAGTWFLFKK